MYKVLTYIVYNDQTILKHYKHAVFQLDWTVFYPEEGVCVCECVCVCVCVGGGGGGG